MRKLIQIGAFVLAIAGQASLCWAESVTVERVVPLDSSGVVRLAVVNNGKPMAGVKVEFYLSDSGVRPETPTLTLVSDESGWIKSAKLADGHYQVVATAEHNLQADLFLNVASHYRNKPSSFKMELGPAPPSVADLERERLEETPIASHLQVFGGSIFDLSGAAIPGASIRIFRRGTGPLVLVETLKAGKSGEFEAKLDSGTYVAKFNCLGFAEKLVGFEIVSSGSEQLTVTLNLASC